MTQQNNDTALNPFRQYLLMTAGLSVTLAGIVLLYLIDISEANSMRTASLIPASDIHRNMVPVPVGEFWYGCASSEVTDCRDNESPLHRQYLDHYWIDKYEVSVADYRNCVLAGACSSEGLKIPVWFHNEHHEELAWACNWGKPDRDKHPINCVSWYQASEYCSWLGKRLPTDMEFEKAARGSIDNRIYPWGNRGYTKVTMVANIADRSALVAFPNWPSTQDYDDTAVSTAAVGSYPAGASPYGVFDLIGNVEEWVSDWYSEDHIYRSIRGASWHRGPERAQISLRYPSDPASHPDYGGFRCASSKGL